MSDPTPATPTVDQWTALMDAERVRQVEKGYDDFHDAEHGVKHLLDWAIDYARRGKAVESATIVRQALMLPERTAARDLELIDSLSYVDEATDPRMIALRVIACLQGRDDWESIEVNE